MNKYLKYVLIVLIMVLLICFYYPFSISKITRPYTGTFTPDTGDLKVTFSPALSKDFEMDDPNLVNELYSHLENLKVRRVIMPPNSYPLEKMGLYTIILHSKEGKHLVVTLFNSDYISINNGTYKFVNQIDLKKIYKLILLDQDKEAIDEYYFNILEQFE